MTLDNVASYCSAAVVLYYIISYTVVLFDIVLSCLCYCDTVNIQSPPPSVIDFFLLFCPLTNQHRHQKPSQPLLLHLLNHGLLTRSRGLAHDRQGIDVRHGANRGGREPGESEERTDRAQDDDEQQVQVKT